MAKKQTQLEKAIASIEADIMVLQQAKVRMITELSKAALRTQQKKPRATKVKAEPISGEA